MWRVVALAVVAAMVLGWVIPWVVFAAALKLMIIALPFAVAISIVLFITQDYWND